MERTFQVAIGISVVLFFVTLNVFFRDSLNKGARDVWSLVAGSETTVTPVPTPPVEEAKTKPKVRARPQPQAAREVEPPEPLKTEAAPPPPKVEPPPPFPMAEELKAGMSRKEMMGRFGAPRFTASWSDNGALSEKFIYTREAQVTAVILRDGQVVTSRTGQNDPWARSAWWQSGSKEKPDENRDGNKAH